MDKYPSTYDRVKYFIENELHIKLTFYKDMILRNLLDDEIQKYIEQLYSNK